MRILTNISKTELDYLTNQPTAKALIEKVKTEGLYIPEGDIQGATEFITRKNTQQEDYLQISEEGMAALKRDTETNEKTTQEDLIKEKIAELKKELAKIKSQNAISEKAKESKEKKTNAIMQQFSLLSMQLVQLQKSNYETGI